MEQKKKQEFKDLYSQHLEELKLQGLSKGTISIYGKAIRRLQESFDSPLRDLTQADLKKHFSNLIDTKTWSTVRCDLYGIKFFWKHVLAKEWEWVDIVKPPRFKTLPDVLSIDEVTELLNSFRIFRYKAFYFVAYSLGLRKEEALSLKIENIDSQRMFVHIRNGKRRKDRIIPLPIQTLKMLRSYYKTHKHPTLIFPEIKHNQANSHSLKQMSYSSVLYAIKAAVEEVGITKRITPHSLRHTYAVHLLEAGLNLRHIQENLGHSSPLTTAIYTQLTDVSQQVSKEIVNDVISTVYGGLTL